MMELFWFSLQLKISPLFLLKIFIITSSGNVSGKLTELCPVAFQCIWNRKLVPFPQIFENKCPLEIWISLEI